MKTPNEVIKGKIVSYDPERQILTIEAHYDDWYTLTGREYKDCNVQLVDGRQLSDKQRKMCYAMIRDIANYTGMGLDPTKEILKIKFLAEELQETADQIFSLSSAPMSLVCAFQKFLIHFIIDWDIPSSRPLLEYVDDIQDYMYACLVAKKCCICGQPTDLHHESHVGMGRNREEIIHEGMTVQPLCREHHTIVHSIGQKTFNDMYHLNGGVVLDKKLCRLYKLKTKKEDVQDV